jgi:hypothetical protein
MPAEQDLPDALKELSYRNGTELTHARWDSDVKLLIEDIQPYLDVSAPAAQPDDDPSSAAAERRTPPASRPSSRRSLWAAAAAMVAVAGISILGYPLWQDRSSAQGRAFAAVQKPTNTSEQRGPDATVAAPPVVAKPAPIPADVPVKAEPTAAQVEAAKAAAAKVAADAAAAKAAAARAAAARKEAEETRRREEAERLAQLAEEQRKRDEETRRRALEQAEKDRLAAEQAAAAKAFMGIAEAIIGGRQNKRR